MLWQLPLLFAAIYYFLGLIDYTLLDIKDHPGIVSDLFVLEKDSVPVSFWLVPLRAIYFSIVTMTTLGFGDMYANAHSLFRGLVGHLLLILQVILGYVLLGALVTRFAVLFNAEGPAGEFVGEPKKKQGHIARTLHILNLSYHRLKQHVPRRVTEEYEKRWKNIFRR